MKIGSAAAVGASFTALDMIGFDAKTGGASAGLAGLTVLFTLVPALLSLAAAAIVMGFPLTAERHAEIRDALAARDLAEAAPEMGADPLITEEIHPAARPAE